MADLSCKGFSTIEERQAWLDWKGYKTPKCRLVNVFQSEDFDKELKTIAAKKLLANERKKESDDLSKRLLKALSRIQTLIRLNEIDVLNNLDTADNCDLFLNNSIKNLFYYSKVKKSIC